MNTVSTFAAINCSRTALPGARRRNRLLRRSRRSGRRLAASSSSQSPTVASVCSSPSMAAKGVTDCSKPAPAGQQAATMYGQHADRKAGVVFGEVELGRKERGPAEIGQRGRVCCHGFSPAVRHAERGRERTSAPAAQARPDGDQLGNREISGGEQQPRRKSAIAADSTSRVRHTICHNASVHWFLRGRAAYAGTPQPSMVARRPLRPAAAPRSRSARRRACRAGLRAGRSR